MVALSGAEEGMIKKVLQLEQLAKAIPRPLNRSSSASIRANREIKCEWEGNNEDLKELRDLTCAEIQKTYEEDKDIKKKFRDICPYGGLDLCSKTTTSGAVAKACLCSSAISPRFHDNCVKKDNGDELCTCSDKDYCNVGVRSGDLPSILTTVILVLVPLGLFGPSLF